MLERCSEPTLDVVVLRFDDDAGKREGGGIPARGPQPGVTEAPPKHLGTWAALERRWRWWRRQAGKPVGLRLCASPTAAPWAAVHDSRSSGGNDASHASAAHPHPSARIPSVPTWRAWLHLHAHVCNTRYPARDLSHQQCDLSTAFCDDGGAGVVPLHLSQWRLCGRQR
jgi:hypothetical protein